VKNFKAPRKALTGLDAETVAGLIVASADIALVLDRRGIVRDLAIPNPDLQAELAADWLGKAFAEVVTEDSRPKIELLIGDVSAGQVRARQVNHPLPDGRTVPIVYTLSPLNGEGRCLAQGRDLRAIAALQQRLIETEQSLERDYTKLRLAETRYRLLLQSIGDAVVTIDAATHKVIELNPAAVRLFGGDPKRLVGKSFTDGFGASSARAIGEWLTGLRTAGRAEALRVRPLETTRDYRLNGILSIENTITLLSSFNHTKNRFVHIRIFNDNDFECSIISRIVGIFNYICRNNCYIFTFCLIYFFAGDFIFPCRFFELNKVGI
jgi:transcriptional regulator PpsR